VEQTDQTAERTDEHAFDRSFFNFFNADPVSLPIRFPRERFPTNQVSKERSVSFPTVLAVIIGYFTFPVGSLEIFP
jgi:hypothetical protein